MPLKIYVYLFLLVTVLSGISYSYKYTYDKGVETGVAEQTIETNKEKKIHTDYLSAMKVQTDKQIKEAENERKLQAARAKASKAKYDRDVAILLERLQELPGMLWDESLCVAGPNGIPVPSPGVPGSKTAETPTFGPGARPYTEFYAIAMTDIMQCRALIDFERSRVK